MLLCIDYDTIIKLISCLRKEKVYEKKFFKRCLYASDSYKIQEGFLSFKSSNKKVIGSKTFGKDFYVVGDGIVNPKARSGIGVKLKKTGRLNMLTHIKPLAENVGKLKILLLSV